MALRLRSANRQLMREINESLVLGIIRERGPISRADIARATRLSAATVTGITNALMAQDLVSEEATGSSTGGRRPILLAFKSEAGIALGVKVTERELVCVATDLAGVPLTESRLPLRHGAAPEDLVALVAAEVARLRGEYSRQRLAGVGIGIAGVVDRPSGVCRLSPFLRWRNVPLRAALEEAVATGVVVENDVNTLTHALRVETLEPDIRTFIVVTLGRGVGLGMMLDGTLFRGARGQGGEFGHITVDPSGPLCECGKRGCLEAIVSLPALVRDASREIDRPLDEREFRQLVMADDARVRDVIERAAETLGRAVAGLVNILNPDAMVLSGEGAWLATRMLPRLTAAMEVHVFDGVSTELRVMVEERGDAFWARGAAGLLLDELFRPQLERTQRAAATLSMTG